MNIPLIVIKTTTDGLGLFTPVNLKGLRLVLEAETKDGDVLLLGPEDVAPHPGCDDPLACFLMVYSHGKYPDCGTCGDYNQLQQTFIVKVFDCLEATLEALRVLLDKMTKGVFL